MSELIDRQAAIEELMNMIEQHKNETPFHGALLHWTGIKAMLLKQPTIEAEPVVKCKECKWWDDYYRECGSPNWYPDQDGSVIQPAGMFCGWGERKTDDKRAKY